MLDTGIVAGTAVSALVASLSLLLAVWVRRLAVEVGEGECVLVTRGRQVVEVLDAPGLHWLGLAQSVGTRRFRISLRHQTCSGAGSWTKPGGEMRVIQVWLDYRVTRPRVAFERMADLPAELKTAVVEQTRRLLTENPDLEKPARREELTAAVLATTQARAQWLGVELSSVVVNLANAPQPAPQVPVFDLTGLPELPRVSDGGWRS